jgi:succinoglycan biosynthesis protein ExoV
MKLQYYRGQQPNFGDELNTWLWPQLLPGFFDDDTRTLFIGIGSILGAPYDADARKVVFGASYVPAYNSIPPNVHGGDWDIFFVRGPRTARALGLPEHLGIGDPAVLLRALNVQFQREPRYIGFMPHWESVPRGNWRAACALAGIQFIDPTESVERVITDILGCTVLICEAMHGAIVADTLRVPWIPVLPIEHAHRDKWLDWADAMNLTLRRPRLIPSTAAEVQIATFYRPRLGRLSGNLASSALSRVAKPLLTYAAAQRLTTLAKEYPSLSRDDLLEDTVQKMREELTQLETRYRK